jgi:hypothetical protein
MSSILAKKKLLMAQSGGIDISEIFNVSLYTETGSPVSVTTGIDSSFGSLVWEKSRDAVSSNVLFDTERGGQNYISSDQSAAQGSISSPFGVSFNSNGYSTYWYNSGTSVVGWQFRRAEKFCDIIPYAGSASAVVLNHSLGVVPGLVIVKRLNSAANWAVYHISQGVSKGGQLNTTDAFLTPTPAFFTSTPTDTTFTIGQHAFVSGSGNNYIAYLFAHDPSPGGVIQCGSYVGNGSATGPVVNLGWRPQYLMIKNATGTGDWQIIDASRGFTAANDAILLANTSGAETSLNLVNPDSTGFQIASTASNVNTSGQTYIYMAIREAA